MTIQPPARWRVRRSSGLLVPGFRKRFDREAGSGMTSFLGVPIGRFDVVPATDGVELRYRRWPVVDVLSELPGQTPDPAAAAPDGAGYLRLPGGRRVRFCRFQLDRAPSSRQARR